MTNDAERFELSPLEAECGVPDRAPCLARTYHMGRLFHIESPTHRNMPAARMRYSVVHEDRSL